MRVHTKHNNHNIAVISCHFYFFLYYLYTPFYLAYQRHWEVFLTITAAVEYGGDGFREA